MTYNIIDVVDWTEPPTITVKKQIWNKEKQQFEPRVFTRWKRRSQSELDKDIKFLTENYGDPSTQGMWWTDERGRGQHYLWIADSAATFWALKFN